MERNMRKISWMKIIRSWWGRMLIGAFMGGVLMAWMTIEDPKLVFLGMAAGALTLFFLGRLK
jgi:hypothetical protein